MVKLLEPSSVVPEVERKQPVERKPRGTPERDVLIEVRALLERLQTYKAFRGSQRSTGDQIDRLLGKLAEIL
jgi:hypothetical protein